MIERLKDARSFKPGIPFTIGTFRIMPVAARHSAFDAYAFRSVGIINDHAPECHMFEKIGGTIIK